jgi:hypothetical protein
MAVIASISFSSFTQKHSPTEDKIEVTNSCCWLLTSSFANSPVTPL